MVIGRQSSVLRRLEERRGPWFVVVVMVVVMVMVVIVVMVMVMVMVVVVVVVMVVFVVVVVFGRMPAGLENECPGISSYQFT